MIQTKNSLVGTLSAKQSLSGNLNNAIVKVYPELEPLEITPSLEEQNFKPNKYGYNEVKVNPIEGDTLEVTPRLEQQSFEGVFSKVDINPIEGDKLEVIPNKENQQFNGVYDDVTVKPIPDEYITPEGTINISENGNIDISKYANANVKVKTSAVQSKGVDFVDYDGTLLYSYTLEEIQELTELPELPISKGLICQEWNWTLEDIKEFGKELTVGATYITDDGKTRLYIHIETDARMNVPICFRQTVSNGVEVDWGDGSPVETFEGSGTTNILPTHQYSNAGDYVVTLNPINCTLTLGAVSSSYCIMGSNSNANLQYQCMLTKVEVGKNVVINSYAFQYCGLLSKVVIPNSVTNINNHVFYYCRSLQAVVIPNSVTNVGSYAFSNCHSLSEIIIPNSVTTMGSYAFSSCDSLTRTVISKKLNTITNSVWSSCKKITEVVIQNGPVSIQNRSFENCYLLLKIVIPNSVTSIEGLAFSGCRSLSEIVIPNSVTSIGTKAFYGCYILPEIVIPSGVTNIAAETFYACWGMTKCDFSKHTQVPTLSNTNAFANTSTDCKIIVPDDLYDEWIVATNWSTYASKIVKASEV